VNTLSTETSETAERIGAEGRSALAAPDSSVALAATRGGGRLPAATRLGPVELTVSDLERAVAFYTEAIGLRVHRDEGAVAGSDREVEADRAALGAGGEDLLVLVESRSARAAGRHAGLYHVALLYPTREELARAAVRLAVTRTPIQGASDHGTHEAIYLADPDGNGLELAADRPRERWPDIGDPSLFAGGPRPLDMGGLVDAVAAERPTPRAERGLRVGHVHLHVGDTAAALRFYTQVIGFETVVELGSAAAFVSVGGYHHHLAFNVWRGQGVPAAPADAVGLRHWTVYVPGAADVGAVQGRLERAGLEFESRGAGLQSHGAGLLVRDPSGNAVLIAADPRAGG
jgi:catechol 2,3-dioxygenase